MRLFSLNECIWEWVLGSRVPEVKSERQHAQGKQLLTEQPCRLQHRCAMQATLLGGVVRGEVSRKGRERATEQPGEGKVPACAERRL